MKINDFANVDEFIKYAKKNGLDGIAGSLEGIVNDHNSEIDELNKTAENSLVSNDAYILCQLKYISELLLYLCSLDSSRIQMEIAEKPDS